MAGVVAGSAIEKFKDQSNRVRLVALTVNNVCNLKCPHCYLQYDHPNEYFCEAYQSTLLSQPFDHLAIVGMEPFVSRRSSERTMALGVYARHAGKSVSAITNGFGLRFLDDRARSTFDFIDVSFDGGAQTYDTFRSASFQRLAHCLNVVRPLGLVLNALHTLFRENIQYIDDMLSVSQYYDFGSIIFSPYVETLNDGINGVRTISILEIMQKLAESEPFHDHANAYLLLDSYHLDGEGITEGHVCAEAARLGILDKVHFVPSTPLQIGSVRVTYDGLILAPSAALHTSLYSRNGIQLGGCSLARAYQEFVQKERLKPTRNVAARRG